jgi:hypothetical protein
MDRRLEMPQAHDAEARSGSGSSNSFQRQDRRFAETFIADRRAEAGQSRKNSDVRADVIAINSKTLHGPGVRGAPTPRARAGQGRGKIPNLLDMVRALAKATIRGRTLPMDDTHTRAIRVWLYAVAALVLAMVLIGGATRLTESGLSITEWKPVMGVLPPLSERAWQAAFEKYRAIPQYREFKRGMSLAEFKTIYWWEWTHRLLGRVIGIAYLLPFLWFLWRGWVGSDLRQRLWFIFGLGALQGAVGWWMVASGLAERVEVSQYRLATHLLLACAICVALIRTASRLRDRPAVPAPGRIRLTAGGLLILVLVPSLSRRTGCRIARGLCVQHLAADRRRVDT